jgi:hypothetical protein
VLLQSRALGPADEVAKHLVDPLPVGSRIRRRLGCCSSIPRMPTKADTPVWQQSQTSVRRARSYRDAGEHIGCDYGCTTAPARYSLRQKISGSLRTLAGAQQFCAFRSYLVTAAKHGRNLIDVLTRLTAGDPRTR